MSLRGAFSGLLALTFLQAVLSSTGSAHRTAGLLSVVNSGVARFLSPTVAAIPDLRDKRKIVAPGEIGKEPLAKIPQTSSTMPDDWTTKVAPPTSIQI